jgi:hypothetical protein
VFNHEAQIHTLPLLRFQDEKTVTSQIHTQSILVLEKTTQKRNVHNCLFHLQCTLTPTAQRHRNHTQGVAFSCIKIALQGSSTMMHLPREERCHWRPELPEWSVLSRNSNWSAPWSHMIIVTETRKRSHSLRFPTWSTTRSSAPPIIWHHETVKNTQHPHLSKRFATPHEHNTDTFKVPNRPLTSTQNGFYWQWFEMRG